MLGRCGSWSPAIRAGRDNHVIGGVAHSVNLDDTRTGESAAAAQQADAPVLQPALLPGLGVVGDHEVTPSKRRLNIDLCIRCRSTGTSTASSGRSSVFDWIQAHY